MICDFKSRITNHESRLCSSLICAARAQFCINLENTAVRAYEDAHRNLRDARTMQVVTTILGNQAQHLVVLRQIAGRPPVPGAFERGRS